MPSPDRDPREVVAEKQAFLDAVQRHQREGGQPPEIPPSLQDPSWVHIGGGVSLPTHFGDEFPDPTRGLQVDVECTVIDGKPVCTSLKVSRLDGAPLEAADLVNLPLDDYADEASAKWSWQMPIGSPIARHVAEIDDPEVHAPARDLSFKHRRYVTDNELRRVAAVYRSAHATGSPPVKAVMSGLDVSRATAGRLIKRARERKFLGPAISRKAGEADKERPS
jgi:Family of unknown function (DUF6214)